MLQISGLQIEVSATGSPLVQDVSLTVSAGKTTCVVGESGSGKSLTALSIMGLLPSALRMTSGRLQFQQYDLTTLPPDARRKMRGKKMAMIFQEPMTSLNPVLTAGHQIAEVLTLHSGLKHQRLKTQITRLLEQVGMPGECAHCYPDELSGGQRQRIMIAMAIACEPALLIADEPTTALDCTTQVQILSLLDTLIQQQNMGMLFITHDFGIVADIADEVVVMHQGRVVESGSVDAVLMHARHPYTQTLLNCVPDYASQKSYLPVQP